MKTGSSIRKAKFTICLLAGLVIIGFLSLGQFSSSSICNICGARQSMTEWQIFHVHRLTILHFSSVQETPISRTLTSLGMVKQHEHQWHFCQGSGNGITCSLGDGHLLISSMESEDLAHLIQALNEFGEIKFRDKILTNLFNCKTSRFVSGQQAPSNCYSNASDLHAWVTEEEPYFDEEVIALRKLK